MGVHTEHGAPPHSGEKRERKDPQIGVKKESPQGPHKRYQHLLKVPHKRY
jgi:hypothetical protein